MEQNVTICIKISKQLKEKIQRLNIKPSKIMRKALDDDVKRREIEELKKEITQLKPILQKVNVNDAVRSVREDKDSR